MLSSRPDNVYDSKGDNWLLIVYSNWYKYEAELGQSHYNFEGIVDSSICQLDVEDK